MSLQAFLLVLVALLSVGQATFAAKILFVYPNEPNDFGYAYAVELARIHTERTLTSKAYNYSLQTDYIVVKNTSTAVDDIMPYLESGFALVFFGGGQFTTAMNKLAPLYPDVKFVGTSAIPVYANTMGVQTANYPWYFLNGLLCGMVSQSNHVAYLTVWKNHADPYLNANAFYYGAKMANPTITVRVVSSDSYSDDIVGRYIIDELVTQGVDCFAINQNTQTANARASHHGVASCGTSSDSRFLAGEHVFTSGIRDWNHRALSVAKSFLDGEWQDYALVSDGFNQSALHLAWWSTLATEARYDTMRHTIEDWVERLTSSEQEQLFCGQLASLTTGRDFMPDECMTLLELLSTRNTVPGIVMGKNYTRESVTRLRYIRSTDTAGVIVIVLASLVCVILVVNMVHLNILRERSAYKWSSSFFMMLILVGMFMIVVSCFFWSLKPSKAACGLRAWIAGIGWSLIASAILAKMHRIYKIFTLRDFKAKAITNAKQLFKFVVGIVAGEVSVLIFWQSLAPLDAGRKVVPSLAYNELYEYCKSKSDIPLAIFLAYNAIIVLPVAVIAWKTRTVVEEYNESSSVGLASAVTIFLGIIVIGTTRIVQDNIVAQYVLPTVGLLCIVCAMYILIFLPKVLYVHGIWDLSESVPSRVTMTITTSKHSKSSNEKPKETSANPGKTRSKTRSSERHTPV